MHVILFDDPGTWKKLLPLTFAKPVSHLKIGLFTIAQKWGRYLGLDVQIKTAEHLQSQFDLTPCDDNLYINSSYIPDELLVSVVVRLAPGEYIHVNDELLAYRGKTPDQFDPELEFPIEFTPNKLQHPWDLLHFSKNEFLIDLNNYVKRKKFITTESPNIRIYGEKEVYIEEGVQIIDCIINADQGPVIIRSGAQIGEGAIIKGPCLIDSNAIIAIGAKIREGCYIGQNCYVGGELKNTIFLANSNKAHEGYLGDSIIGEHCNLGSLTNSSNLKNNYSTIKAYDYHSENFIDTNRDKLGLIMGDYTHTAVSSIFNTGSVTGFMTNIALSGFNPKNTPPFTWATDQGSTTYQLDKAIQLAERISALKKKKLSDSDKEIIKAIFELTKAYSQQ